MSLTTKLDGFKVLWQFDNRWQLIASRLFFSKENVHVYRYKGVEVLVDRAAGEATITGEVMTSPMYREYLAEMNFTRPINMFDIGSNNGTFPLTVKAEGIELNKLVCIEMNPSTFSRLRFNAERNLNGTDVTLINGALCGEHREIEVSVGVGAADDSIYHKREGGKTSVIQGYTFDEICESEFGGEGIDLCKMDIEGAEFEVLSSPGHDYLKKVKNLLVEIHVSQQNNDRALAIRKFEELGFTELHGENKNVDKKDFVHFFTRK